jgi:hypothetical protein
LYWINFDPGQPGIFTQGSTKNIILSRFEIDPEMGDGDSKAQNTEIGMCPLTSRISEFHSEFLEQYLCISCSKFDEISTVGKHFLSSTIVRFQLWDCGLKVINEFYKEIEGRLTNLAN